MRATVLVLLLISSSLYLMNCDKPEVQPEVSVTGFSPASGIAGTAITISGNHFSASEGKNEVKFNGVTAVITAATSTEITATVPEGSTTGKITVTVNAKTGTSENDFVVIQPATIASFNPTSGHAPHNGAAGTTIIITGANFSTTATENAVKFGNTAAVVTAATETQLTTMVPEGATTGKISVTVHGKTVTSETDFTIILPPSISSFNPASGNAGYSDVAGTTITITGSHFSTTPTSNVVKFGNATAVVTAATETQLTTTVPYGASTGKLSVTVNNLLSESANNFTVLTTPIINSITPVNGVPGSIVTVRGFNFSETAANNVVTFNGMQGTVTESTPVQLKVTVPDNATNGKININVSAQNVTSADDFEVLKDLPRQGLIAFYPFTGNSRDASGNNKNLIASNQTTTPAAATDRFGKAAQAYTFDGVNDQLYVSDIVITNPVTYSFWTTFTSPDNTGGIIGTKSGTVKGFAMQNSIQAFILYVDDNVSYNTVSVLPAAPNGEWFCYTITYDGSIMKVYKNGTLVDTKGPTPGNITSTGHFIVGSSQNGGAYAGGIDDVAVYNRVLSEAEVVQLYQQTASKY